MYQIVGINHKIFAYVLLCICVLSLLGCEQSKTAPDPLVDFRLLEEARSQINLIIPGRGVTDYPGNTVDNVPKSMAMVLLGDLAIKNRPEFKKLKDLGSVAGNWLLEHADENHDGIIGWGVPIAWDAYNDNSVNPANTEYSITTGIVIDALLAWLESGYAPSNKHLLSICWKAAEPYLDDNKWSPTGLLPYSLQASDQKYDTFNSAAYLAGQLQRLSLLVDSEKSVRLRKAADSTMSSLLQHKKISPETGAWYWNYSIQENAPNDVPHASYIIEGIKTYILSGGALSAQFDFDKISTHLLEFVPIDFTGIRALPRFLESVKEPARLYGLGQALYMACSDNHLESIRHRLVESVGRYQTANGHYAKYPTEFSPEPLVVAEYESYLYRGLATCFEKTMPIDKVVGDALIRVPVPPAKKNDYIAPEIDPSSAVEVPFVVLDPTDLAVKTRYIPKTHFSEISFDNGRRWSKFSMAGIPVGLCRGESYGAIFFREIPTNQLRLFELKGKKLTGKSIIIQGVSDSKPMFRAVGATKDVISLIYYDNSKLSNFIQFFSVTNKGIKPKGAPVVLPSLEDPAGHTYEMIPKIFIMANENVFHILGGTLDFSISASGKLITSNRIPNCKRVIEAVLTPSGPVTLCDRPDGGYQISYVDRQKTQVISDETGIPWKLHVTKNGQATVDFANNNETFRQMFLRDLSSCQQSGWLEFATNNEEGRIPWSQIYYLNGFMDILFLCDKDEHAFQVFEPILKDIRKRLDLELSIIDWHWSEGRYQVRAFTVDRSSALFGVQTSRLLLLMKRYLSEIAEPIHLKSYQELKRSVLKLDGHIEKMAYSGEKSSWITDGKAYLRWPKGCKFYFDGVGVPFNHQNEWANAVFRVSGSETEESSSAIDDAIQIVDFFIKKITSEGRFPESGEWDYWWGTAYDGWNTGDNVSINKPEYVGDKGKAWISFRTIDMMAMLSARPFLPQKIADNLTESSARLIHDGLVYPFTSYELYLSNEFPDLSKDVMRKYVRVSSPWEVQNSVWAISKLCSCL